MIHGTPLPGTHKAREVTPSSAGAILSPLLIPPADIVFLIKRRHLCSLIALTCFILTPLHGFTDFIRLTPPSEGIYTFSSNGTGENISVFGEWTLETSFTGGNNEETAYTTIDTSDSPDEIKLTTFSPGGIGFEELAGGGRTSISGVRNETSLSYTNSRTFNLDLEFDIFSSGYGFSVIYVEKNGVTQTLAGRSYPIIDYTDTLLPNETIRVRLVTISTASETINFWDYTDGRDALMDITITNMAIIPETSQFSLAVGCFTLLILIAIRLRLPQPPAIHRLKPAATLHSSPSQRSMASRK